MKKNSSSQKTTTPKQTTSWNSSSKWYNNIVQDKGHFYHQSIVIPRALKLLNFSQSKPQSLLDLACGQGVLSRHISNEVEYLGIDISKNLIKSAQQMNKSKLAQFISQDVTLKLQTKKEDFTHAAIVLALQNIANGQLVIKNAFDHLGKNGKLLIILNHPCFRIPRQSEWLVDKEQMQQSRKIKSYMSAMEIPIQTNPSKGASSEQTISFHHPLTSYFQWLNSSGFMVQSVEEWCSEKESMGKSPAAKMENRARAQIPLFMAILAVKI